MERLDAPMLKVADVARILNLPLSSAYHLIRCGSIPGVVRLGTRIRVNRVEFEAFVKQAAA